MATNKVVYGDEVLMDISQDSVTAENLAYGETAHDKHGNPVVGKMTKNADTVDGWHVDVRSDGSAPPSGTFNTISFVYTGG